MNIRRHVAILLLAFFSATGLAAQPSSSDPATISVARVHWLGLKQISADTNAARFMSVWQMPQTIALVAQTLDKLSRWPGHGATNAASARLRPLLDDLISSEFYLELSVPTNSQFAIRNSQLTAAPANSSLSAGGAGRGEVDFANFQLLLAVRLSDARFRLWQTNLAAAAAMLTGPATPPQVEWSRAGEWTLVGVGPDANISQTEFAARFIHPQPPAATNFWLEAGLDLPRLVPAFSTFNFQLSTFNRLGLTVTGEAGFVLTCGTLDCSRPFDVPLPPWEIPTNLIHGPLNSFAAVRGLTAWLSDWPAWQKLQLAPPPDQAYFWTQESGPLQSFFAAPLPGASNQLFQLAARLGQNANPWLATNADGNFQWQAGMPGLVWSDIFILVPFLKPVLVSHHDYVFGGVAPFVEDNPKPMPAEFLRTVLNTTNLVYYQAEQTGARVEDDLFIGQELRITFHKPQLPDTTALWLKNIGPALGGSATFVTRSGAQQLALTRYSTLGFNALELHLLADWLESPQFPRGLHTFLAPPDK